MDIRNELKSYIIKEGMTMRELVDMLAYEYDWSDSVPNFRANSAEDLCDIQKLSKWLMLWDMILFG